MHFVHTPIVPQGEIEYCTVFDARLPREFDVLLLYHKFIIIATIQIQKKEKELAFKSSPPMHIETPLLWAAVVENHLISVTESKKLIITETGSSTGKIAEVNLCLPNFNDNNFKFFSISKDNSNIFISSDSDQFYSVDISDISHPRITLKTIESHKIVSVGCDDEGFIILVESEEGEKKAAFYNTSTGELTLEEADQDITEIIDSDVKSKQFYCYFKNNTIENSSEQVIAKPEEKICCHSNVVYDSLAYQVESNVLYITSANKDQSQAISTITSAEDGETIDMPKINKMWLLPCENVLCNLENGKNIIISVQKTAAQGRKKAQVQYKYLELEGFFACHTLVNCNGMVYGASKSGISLISEHAVMENSAKHDDTVQKKLTQITNDAVVATGDNEANIVVGSSKFCTSKSADMFVVFRKTVYIVSDNQIIDPSGKAVVEFDKPIKAIASSGFRVLVVTGTNSLAFFNESFNQRDDLTLSGEITAIAMTDNYFAVYCYDNSPIVKNGNLSLFSFSFDRVCPDIHLPSTVTSLSFGRNKTELLVSCSNGSLLRIPVSKYGILPYITLIYAGKAPAKLIPVVNNDKVHIVTFGNSAYILYDDQLKDLGISGFDSICGYEDDDGFSIFIIKDGEIIEIPYDYKVKKQYRRPIENTDDIVEIKSYNDRAFFIRQTEEGSVVSMLYNDNIISSEPVDREATHICITQHLSEFFVIVTYNKPEPCVALFVSNDDNIRLAWTTPLSSSVTCCSAFMDSLIISTENRLSYYNITHDSLEATKCVCRIEKPLTNMLWINENIWTVDSSGTVSVLCYNEGAERFEIVSRVTNIEGIKSIAPIDDISIAAGCSNGYVHIIRMPKSRALGFSADKSLEMLSMMLDTPIESVVKVNNSILYLTSYCSVGGFIPFQNKNGFCMMQEEQRKLREQHQEKYGFCVPSKRSLLSQYPVVDSTLFEAFVEKPNIKEEDQQKLRQLYTSNALLIGTRRNIMF